ncbi:LIM domain only protein 7-like isoform X2 [Salarias fasciatus]|uniref:LIM domain only protein 7-like isoform X2 n=1 Tax=Salarias fasciatus TaxID=181472 RepID=UPI001176DD98|nr:LIM domain only protein 7 isoform X2 [Salarias fasciatus]
MEWREQSAVSCDQAYLEAQRWIEAVTKKKFGSSDFRSELENGVQLCDLINQIKPGIIKRVNRLPTPIAGLDNLNVFLKACGKLGLKEAQLFDPGDLQDLSSRVTVKDEETSRRLKNVLITVYWLGRRAQSEPSYDGPYLNLKAFEGLLGTALYKALQDSSAQKGSSVRDSGFSDAWYSEREELSHLRGGGGGGGGGGGHRRDNSLDSLDSLGSRPHSISSETTLKGSSEGCGSDTEADSVYKMADKDSGGYRRSLNITPKPTAPFNQFLPSKDKATGYVPAPLRKKRAERNEDVRRSWSSSTYAEDEGNFTRQEPTQEDDDGSKSASDILAEQTITRQQRYEELQRFREQIKESDDKWQDDLSKWKNRRRSVNSDIVKKKEERERIEQITSGSSRRSKTFKEMQEEREEKGGRLSSLSYLNDDGDVFDQPVISPRSRTLPARSYTIDTPYYSSETSVTSRKEVEPRAASSSSSSDGSPPSTRRADQVDSSLRRTASPTPAVAPYSHSSLSLPRSPAAEPPQRSPLLRRAAAAATEPAEPSRIISSFVSRQQAAEPRRPLLDTQTRVEPPSSGSLYKQQPSSMEPNPPGVSRVSASLPRSYQRSNSARLTSVVTPRPFGSQASRIASLPRPQTMDDSQKRINGDADVSKRSSVPNRFHQFMTPEDDAESSSSQSSEEEEEEEEKVTTTKSITSTQTVTSNRGLSSISSQIKSESLVSPAKETSQENCCEMRISLNQKPGSGRDFGFQASWDSTGARVKLIQPGSPAQMCQLQLGDEVLTVNGHKVADMSYMGWKSHMEEALQEGSLVMDIRRHGQINWDRDEPSLPFKSHKIINLTSMDHPTILGSPESSVVSPSLDLTTRIPPDTVLSKEFSSRPVLDVASNGVNGGFREESVTMRNKETEPISLKNLKRRSEFFETGGSDSAVPDIHVPSITPSSSRWSWDPEEERKRQEKWQKEQERLLQEKYKRDQEKLQEEWLKAQQEITTNDNPQELRSLEVNSYSFSPRSPLASLKQPTSFPWEEEERKRKEEQERQRQAEERRKREEEERELQRLQEERKRREREEEEEKRRREEEHLRWQKRKEEEQQERRRREYAEQQRRESERLLEQRQRQQQWTKSQSSPQLDEVEKPQAKGAPGQRGGLAHWLLEEQTRIVQDPRSRSEQAASELELERRHILNAMKYREPERVAGSGFADRKSLQPSSQAELERQQILNEMKKKTSLLGDNSWIRQRSSSSAARPEAGIPPMRRGESLDHLEKSSWRSSWTPRSSSYAQSQPRPHSALSGSTSSYSGLTGLQRPASAALHSSYSLGSLRSGAGTPSSLWSQQSLSPSSSSTSPATSPEPSYEAGAPPLRSRSVSGKKICTLCENPLGKGAAMIIESLGLCYHLSCFKCFDCKSDLGGSEAGAEVRIRSKQLYCNNCYMRFKTGQPTAM